MKYSSSKIGKLFFIAKLSWTNLGSFFFWGKFYLLDIPFIPKQYFGYLDKGQFLVKRFYHVGYSAVNSTDQSI